MGKGFVVFDTDERGICINRLGIMEGSSFASWKFIGRTRLRVGCIESMPPLDPVSIVSNIGIFLKSRDIYSPIATTIVLLPPSPHVMGSNAAAYHVRMAASTDQTLFPSKLVPPHPPLRHRSFPRLPHQR
jgi:hypothetical protein